MEESESNDPHKRGAPKKRNRPNPIRPAPFDNDPEKTVDQYLDRLIGKPVSADQVKTFAEVLAQHQVSSESKFENGEFLGSGTTKCRHVRVDSVR